MKKLIAFCMLMACMMCGFTAKAYQPTSNELITGVVDEMNSMMPMELSEGMTMTSVSVDDSYFIFNILVSPELGIDFNALQMMREPLKQIMLTSIVSSDDANTKLMLSFCEDSNIGLSFKFWSKESKEKIDINISAAELKAHL